MYVLKPGLTATNHQCLQYIAETGTFTLTGEGASGDGVRPGSPDPLLWHAACELLSGTKREQYMYNAIIVRCAATHLPAALCTCCLPAATNTASVLSDVPPDIMTKFKEVSPHRRKWLLENSGGPVTVRCSKAPKGFCCTGQKIGDSILRWLHEQVPAHVRSAFDEADMNQSGKLEAEELVALLQSIPGGRSPERVRSVRLTICSLTIVIVVI